MHSAQEHPIAGVFIL